MLTTLQCNFACDYCFQGDHGDYNKFADKMSLETAARVGDWIERELDRVQPEKLVLTFFGGEPLLNLPVMYYLAERHVARARRRAASTMCVNIITNGLLLTPEVVDRLLPFGLNGVKITLDGDRDTHNRMRPLRGGQGTFDRIIENIRSVAGRVPDRHRRQLRRELGRQLSRRCSSSCKRAGLRRQARQGQLQAGRPDRQAGDAEGHHAADAGRRASGKPLDGTCMTVGRRGRRRRPATPATSLDDKMSFLREETKRHGFPTPDGVHNGPCHVHMTARAHDRPRRFALRRAPGSPATSSRCRPAISTTGATPWREIAREKFDRLHPWKDCGDCAFIPVCAGGCVAASHSQLGDMNMPTCHKRSFESALIALAHDVASAAA